ncbi:hypothetical protein [Streptomyces sp. NPDC086023]|uniref:hypothetical protein n=1 Tax=Streptomyces sp. NPDC086023 TaxID=3365746 RepID=UPI0037D516FB
MYLVHVALRPPPGAALDAELPTLLRALARPEERVEHVVAHPDSLPYPVLGFFLLSGSLADAERAAHAVGRRGTELLAALRGWTVLCAEVPLIAPLMEFAAASAEGRDGSGQDRIRPSRSSSDRLWGSEN